MASDPHMRILHYQQEAKQADEEAALLKRRIRTARQQCVTATRRASDAEREVQRTGSALEALLDEAKRKGIEV